MLVSLSDLVCLRDNIRGVTKSNEICDRRSDEKLITDQSAESPEGASVTWFRLKPIRKMWLDEENLIFPDPDNFETKSSCLIGRTKSLRPYRIMAHYSKLPNKGTDKS